MHLIYIDDSGDEELCVFSALMIRADKWNSCLEEIKNFRRDIQTSDGISVYTEFHAWKFVSGRGKIADGVVPKGRRCQIFKQTLQMIAMLPEARLFNVVFPTKASGHAYEALLEGINRGLQTWDSHAILICDEGKDAIYTRLVRRMQASKDGAIDRILEDPFFKQSDQSYFIQLSDFCAYALLRQEHPIESKTKYGLDEAFNLLEPISEGIIRPNP
ncbi:MAG: DUF3800 domain-containing protein [Candidatus Poribacteria bacterium]|nr:DUF3800 domain-containing protein [Candidatus Poribacteria bacterium]